MSKKKSHRKPGAQPGKSRVVGAGENTAKKTVIKKPAYEMRKTARNSKKSAASKAWMWYALGGTAILVVITVLAYLLVQDKSAAVEVQIPASQAFEKYQSGAFFLDVRSQEEWDEIHIPSSTLIPLDELPARLAELPTNREIVAVCLVGLRSQEGQKILAKAGFENTFCLDGGIQEWQAAGYPTEGS